jgi:hypothetical protein
MLSKELERIWKDAIIVLICGTNEDTDKNQKPLSEWFVTQIRFEPCTSQTKIRIITA